jgi:hypothetical protein
MEIVPAILEKNFSHIKEKIEKVCDISNIARFPSNPSNGDTIVFNSSTNQWVATTGSTSINASSSGSGVTSITTGTATQVTLNTNAFANGIT